MSLSSVKFLPSDLDALIADSSVEVGDLTVELRHRLASDAYMVASLILQISPDAADVFDSQVIALIRPIENRGEFLAFSGMLSHLLQGASKVDYAPPQEMIQSRLQWALHALDDTGD